MTGKLKKVTTALESKPRSRALRPGTPADEVSALVVYADQAYKEGYRAGLDAKLEEHQAQQVGREAFRNCLPILNSIKAAQGFIACVAQGLARAWLSPEDARVMMYTAQTAITLLKKAGQK